MYVFANHNEPIEPLTLESIRGNLGHLGQILNVVILDMAKVSNDFLKHLDQIEEAKNNKAFTALSVHAFPPILSYDEWEVILKRLVKLHF